MMKRSITSSAKLAAVSLAFLLLTVSVAKASWSRHPTPVSKNKPLHEIPFEYDVDKIVVPVKVNGSKAIRCILDTGMPEGLFIMNPDVGKEMNLKYALTQVQIGGAGANMETASMAMGAELDMAGVLLKGQRVIVKNKSDHFSHTDWVGVIGASIFNKYVVEIDTEKEVIKLFDPKGYDSSKSGEALDLTITRTKPYITIPVSVDGKKAIPVKTVVDTGASSALMLSADSNPGFVIPDKSIQGVFGAGIGGDVTGKMVRVEKVAFGRHSLNNVVTLFKNGPVPANGQGLIGMRILERFLITFDYQNKKMYLKPNGNFDKPFEYDMIGLALRPAASGMRVADVIKGSPAFEAGIRKDDVITGFNGQEATFDRWSNVNNRLRKPGKKLTIKWKSGDSEFEKQIVTKRLI
ncbi:MAG: PDZ domain-containing protein [Pyrinomonadaceae bacterium]|nr:PDZ domain-containing protein [Pyrinomonadaceae bacterium]